MQRLPGCFCFTSYGLFVNFNSGSGYRAEYRPLIENGQPFLEVRVTGKAAKLAVMLTDPKGKTETQVIEENEMITNAKTVRLAMQQKPEAGTYTLLVKTFQPERVVYKATPKFTRGRLTILDAQFKWKPWTGGGISSQKRSRLQSKTKGACRYVLTDLSLPLVSSVANKDVLLKERMEEWKR